VDVLFLYDDAPVMPPLIRQIINVDRFSAIVRRKRRLGDIIAAAVDGIEHVRFVATAARGNAADLDVLERLPADTMVLRLPSCIAPSDVAGLQHLVRKLPYAPGTTLLARFEDEAVALLDLTDTAALLKITEPRERRAFFAQIAESAVQIDNVAGFTDLRDVNGFLSFMTGATEVRHFNAMQSLAGVYRKSSTDMAKMRAEYRFFHVVPESLKRFLLPTFNYQEQGGSASYEMEKLSVPDAALQIVHHSFTRASFAKLLDSFFDFIATRERRATGAPAVRDAARQEIAGKVDRRLAQLMANPIGERVDQLLRAAGPMGGIADLQARAQTIINRAIDRDPADYLAVSHGDPCLSNILFNGDLGLFRLIDPRGAETLEGTFMHPLYDLAKFSHSVVGGYDFINNGLFECRLDGNNELALELDGNGPPLWMREAFAERVAHAGFDMRAVRAIELSLFMSMLPLHIDVPRKLPAFALTASAIITEMETDR
jgi:hypothetical protein